MKEVRAELLCFALAALLALATALGPGGLFTPRREFRGGPPPTEGIRVLTWNVGGSGGAVGGHALLEKHIESVIETLLTLQPDLVLLQELADTRQLLRIRNGLGSPSGADPEYRARKVRGRYVGVIALRGRLEDHGGDEARLDATWRIEGRSPIALTNIHADPWRARKRNHAVGAALEALMGTPAPARLLVGDLNLDVDPGARRDLFSDRADRDAETYGYLATHLVDAGLGSGSTAEPERRLDYLFFDPEGLTLVECAPSRRHRRGDMDHHPVVADFRWP